MSRFNIVNSQSSDSFLRDVGISRETFFYILDKVSAYIENEKRRQPMKRRGKKSQSLTLADKLLLTLEYFRHYPTFAKLGQNFGISESYANKIYHKILNILLKVLDMRSEGVVESEDQSRCD